MTDQGHTEISIAMIVARARNGVIGRDGELPWHLADDLALFKAATQGHPIIMGRKTWQSLPRRPLPKRDNIVLTRDGTFSASGAHVFTSMDPALQASKALARQAGKDSVFLIGGEAIYRAGLDYADQLWITEVDVQLEGEAHFPPFQPDAFEEVHAATYPANDRNDFAFTFRHLKRRPPVDEV